MVEMVKVVTLLLLGSWALQAPQRPPKPGVKTPGVKIPIERLKPDAVFPGAGNARLAGDRRAVWVSNKPKDSVSRLDPKTNTVTATIRRRQGALFRRRGRIRQPVGARTAATRR